MAKCADPSCRVPLTAGNRSKDTQTMCREHGDFVWAFRPNSTEPDWFEVTDLSEGVRVSGGQCDVCGLSEMVLRRAGRWRWEALCLGMEWDGEHRDGCGAAHPVRAKPRCEVVLQSA